MDEELASGDRGGGELCGVELVEKHEKRGRKRSCTTSMGRRKRRCGARCTGMEREEEWKGEQEGGGEGEGRREECRSEGRSAIARCMCWTKQMEAVGEGW